MKPFWMVLGSGMPVYRHESESAARNEAGRLARIHTGQEFVVLKSVVSCVVNELRWDESEPEDVGFNDSYVEAVVSQKPQWRDPVLPDDIGLRAQFSDSGKVWSEGRLSGVRLIGNSVRWISSCNIPWALCRVTDDKTEEDVPF